MEDYISIISNVGFPIFLSLFLLIRVEPTLRQLQKTIDKVLFFLEHNDKSN